MYAVIRYVNIIQEGAGKDLFILTAPSNTVLTAIVTTEREVDAAALPIATHITAELAEDINAMRAVGANIDDDNDPAEEKYHTAYNKRRIFI